MRRFVKLTVMSTAVSIVASVLASRWQRRWGTTEGEVVAGLPGDALVPEPASQVTRAITIGAPPEQVWPWLAQIGADRAGFYSFDWLENLFGLDVHSASTVVEEWGDVEVGDVVYATRRRTGGWYVAEVLPNEALVLQVADLRAGRPARRQDPSGWELTWAFVLRPALPAGTRLLVRERVGFGSRRARCLLAPVGPVSFLMTRRMMLGIKERAEAGVVVPAG